MAYIGREPLGGEVILLNSIESQFNGVLTTFNLTRTVSGVTSAFYPVGSQQLLVSLGGVIQRPDPTGDTGFRISFNTIIFAIAPATGTSCFIISYGNLTDIGAPANNTVTTDKLVDGAVTPAKLSTGAPTWTSGGTVTVSGDLNVTGSFNSGTQGLFWQDNEIANFGNSNDLQIYHDGVDSYIRDVGTGNLNIYADNEVTIRNASGNEYKARFITDGAVELYFNGSKKFETNSDGIFVSGTARVPNATAFTSSDSGGTERWLMYMSGGVSPSSGNKLIIGNPLNDDVILFTNNTERLRITGTGNVGIGITNPGAKLVVNGSGNLIRLGDGTNTFDVRFQGPNNWATQLDTTADIFNISRNSVSLVTVRSDGNLGIGTTNPSQRLVVQNGGISVSGAAAPNLNLSPTNGLVGNADISFDGTTFNLVSNSTSASLTLSTSSTERFRITSTGNVGIGTTNPSQPLVVQGTTLINSNSAGSFGTLQVNGDIGLQGVRTIRPAGPGDDQSLTFIGNRLSIGSANSLAYGYTGGGQIASTSNGDGGILFDAGRYSPESRFRVQNTSSNNVQIRLYNASETTFIATTSGNVGIGTASPSYKFDLLGTDTDVVRFRGTSSGVRFQSNSTTMDIVSHNGSDSNTRNLLIRQYGASTGILLDTNGNVGIGTTNPGFRLEVNGSFAATTKSFLIEHPTKENHKLRHGSLEGPENGVYVRGRTSTNIIELPDYWTGLVDEDSITVNLTPIGNRHIWVEEINNNKVYINSEDTIDCFYTVFAERKDVEKLIVEIEEN